MMTSTIAPPTAAPVNPTVKCLLVDDLPENLFALSALLRAEDVQILEARSATEALELLLIHDFALALLDVQMPEMDGFELAELMRGTERTQHVPIIFVTAGARDQHRVFKGYDTGAVDFLYKPVDARVLKNKAQVFFQLHRQKQQLAHELHERTETLRLNELFMAVLGHDLRNPLSAVLASAQFLQKRIQDDAQARDAAGRIVASGKRMRDLIADILDLARSRLTQGLPIRRRPADMAQEIQPVVQEYRVTYPDLAIEFQQRGDLSGEWDVERLLQVVSNLVGNSIQHGAPGQPIGIWLDGSRPDEVELKVVNAGTIPAEIIPTIFDPFQDSERRSPGRGDGLGLGLYIVQQIIHAHHGRVEVQSGDDATTAFLAVVPRRP